MWEFLKWIFKFGTSANEVAIKAMPSEKIQEEKFEQKKPRLEFEEKEKLRKKAFNAIYKNTAVDVGVYVKYALDHLAEDDQQELTALLTADVLRYRKAHPLIFKQWLREQNIK